MRERRWRYFVVKFLVTFFTFSGCTRRMSYSVYVFSSRRCFMKALFLWICVVFCEASFAAEDAPRFRFPDIAARFRVGDTNAVNPISDTEGPKALASADMNGDGLPDIIAANLDGSISILLAETNRFLSPQILTPARGLLTNS